MYCPLQTHFDNIKSFRENTILQFRDGMFDVFYLQIDFTVLLEAIFDKYHPSKLSLETELINRNQRRESRINQNLYLHSW